MSQHVKLLKTHELSDTVSAMNDLNSRVRDRLREEKRRLKLSDRDVAGQLEWPPSRVSQKLLGRTPITMNELAALCFVMGISPTEAVRDTGLEFVAEMTPSELRLFERLKQLTTEDRAAILQILRVLPADARRALPKKAATRGRG